MRVGILGGGQLGRMLALAGYPMGLRFSTLDLSAEAPAGHLTDLMVADFNDTDALKRFAQKVDVVTYEFENVPLESTRFLSRRVPVYPPPEALAAAQDRLLEKSFFRELGIPTPEFSSVDEWDDLKEGLSKIGLPAVLKTRRFGYDGKGQYVLTKAEDAAPAWQALGGVPLILERFVAFARELSVLSVRSRNGESRFYPLVQNHHRKGMLRLSLAPAPDLTDALQREAEDYATRALDALTYVGVLAIEFFEHEGRLLANEMAPRVHNSGHWTIEGAKTSQFENHLRAILGEPLGSTAPQGWSAMINLIGTLPDRRAVMATPNVHLHLYGKAPRPDRKLGHVTLRVDSGEELNVQLDKLKTVLGAV